MKKMVSRNPATGEINEEFELYSGERIDQTLTRARSTFLEWKDLDISERAHHLKMAAAQLRKEKDELGRIITIEMGKPIKESVPEVEKCAWALEYFAENAEEFLAPEAVETDAMESGVSFEPKGVILSIMPWNFPFWQALRFGAPALVGGNTVILKHASSVPMCALAIEKVLLDAGLLEGVFQTLLIDGKTASELIDRDEIAAVTFTGSLNAGSKVAEAAGRNMKKAVLELGGSDPFIVLDDANVEMAAEVGVNSRFLNGGQSCIAAKRFIVTEAVADEFLRVFVESAKQLKVGDPMDPQTDIGPLVNPEQVDLIDAQVKDAVDKGAGTLLEGGRIDSPGSFYKPVVLSNVNENMRVLKEETFGPVAPIVIVKDENEAIRVAGSTDFGLGASIWTEDREHAMELEKHIESGVVSVNSMVASDPRLPFGGTKKSGIGRELYKYGLYEFMNIKSIKVY
ncbi:succinate-semialdehyde dehydrogenase/glutarate-semialdehyde dehydrogenase [Methanohalophilus levihalophilus]|uniref:NAD-dependent succinate-semialdehyde dehydrogenase n=1 Tax=Methanohalophilus levihalophilus TaxID=1431282 RepID=UPI001AE75240|nr:NAD-dependent succinate-semialdehyde dehydrogenase [Methanohalophilus levihalophilus]MBP2030033.1 succinate-semialdehyde dehydrogenase/glutarate-semialdehyde dehydrogenase [Methanohalophilus levihalophilus]